MENNPLPIANSPQTTNAVGQASLTVTQPSTVDSIPKANNFLVILLSVFLFISVVIAGFFAYQTQKLVKELRVMSDESKQTVEPTLEPVSITDPTADWKTYTNEGLFTFNYPNEYVESGMGIMSPLNPTRNQKDFTLQNGELKLEFYPKKFEGQSSSESCWEDNTSGSGRITGKSSVEIGGETYETVLWEGEGTGELLCVVNNGYRILINKYPAETSRQKEYEDILSTFKFTN